MFARSDLDSMVGRGTQVIFVATHSVLQVLSTPSLKLVTAVDLVKISQDPNNRDIIVLKPMLIQNFEVVISVGNVSRAVVVYTFG